MGVYKRAGSDNWWYKFTFQNELIRESTNQTNKRIAEQVEAARKTQLVKGEVGIKDRKRSPLLKTFFETSFLSFYETTKRDSPNTVSFYKSRVLKILKDAELPKKTLDKITSEDIVAYVGRRRKYEPDVSVATLNRELATLKRAFKLAGEWNELETRAPKITLLDGEEGREYILSADQESAYLAAATPLLRAFATIMLDCGLRPDEVYRLQWEANYQGGRLIIHTGKTKAARRAVPVTARVAALLEMQRAAPGCETWIFPALTKAGHIDQSSVKKQHKRAIKDSGVTPFVPYDLRHTCLTRWARYLDPFTLKKLAGHESLETTMKYIHLNESDSENRLMEARQRMKEASSEVRGGHSLGHSSESLGKNTN